MNIYHFTYSHPGYNIGDIPSVVDFFFASDDQLLAIERFKEYSNDFDYDNIWMYDHTMERETAKDAAYFAYYNQDNPQQADDLMVAVLEKSPSIANTTWILEASQYTTPNALKMLLQLLSHEQLPSQLLFKAVAHDNEEGVRILIDSGRVNDPDASALLHACGMEKRNLFDAVLPVSNLDAAMLIASKQNFHWVEDAFAIQQHERLKQSVEIPTAARARKI